MHDLSVTAKVTSWFMTIKNSPLVLMPDTTFTFVSLDKRLNFSSRFLVNR